MKHLFLKQFLKDRKKKAKTGFWLAMNQEKIIANKKTIMCYKCGLFGFG